MKSLGLLVFSIFIFACSDQLSEVQLTDLAEHNMKLIPLNPGSNDEIKLVVYDDCTYNILSEITRNEKIIAIQKQFNSMMKWPCVMKNDTIRIGKLPEGTYTVNYKLVDISTYVTDPIALSFSFGLSVSR